MDRALIRKFLKHKSAVAGLAMLLAVFLLALLADWIAPKSASSADLEVSQQFEKPLKSTLCGRDQLGRDVFGRICHGARISLLIGVAVVAFSLTVGILLGGIAAYCGGWVDLVVMRLTDMLMAFPGILLALTVVAAWGRSLTNVVLAVGIVSIPVFARQIRASVLVLRETEYVLASRALGAGAMRILFLRILPNALGPITVLGSLRLGEAILIVAGLSFLGLGVPPERAEWGLMLQEAQKFAGLNYEYWWVVVFPGLAIAISVLGFNLFGDGLRDLLDPKMKKLVG